jgi:hypothetical protein
MSKALRFRNWYGPSFLFALLILHSLDLSPANSIVQYLNLGGPSELVVTLRGFEDLILDAGESQTFTY